MRRPELAGVAEGGVRAFCTSQPAVREWLARSLTHVFREVPELAGVFTITASENLTSCASHGGQQACPRCRERVYADVIAEVNAAVASGVHAARPEARVLAWDWGWHGHGDAADVIARLPEDVWRAIYHHYLPLGIVPSAPPSRADLGPAAVTWAAVSIADKLDTVVGLFAAGERPTGTRDPFGLRRQAQGLLRTLVDLLFTMRAPHVYP